MAELFKGDLVCCRFSSYALEPRAALRKECPEIGWGSWKTLATRNPHVMAIRYEWRGNAVLVVHNFAAEPQAVAVDVGEDTLVSLLNEDHSKADDGVHRLALDAFAYRWYRVGGLAYILNRER